MTYRRDLSTSEHEFATFRVRDEYGEPLRIDEWVHVLYIVVHRADLSPVIVNMHGCTWGCKREQPIPPAIERHQAIGPHGALSTDDCCVKCASLSRQSAGRMRRGSCLPNLTNTLQLYTETLDPLHHTWLGVLDAELGELEAPRSECDALASLYRRASCP